MPDRFFVKRRQKRASIFVKAAVAVMCALAAVSILLFLQPGQQEVTEPARILFAGTEDDADCAILLSRGMCVMIDSGEEQDGAHILELLEREGVERIDCLILTHPDKDHIGGAPALLEKLSVQTILVPDYGQKKERYETLLQNAEEAGSRVEVLEPAHSRELRYGELLLRVWPPEEAFYEKDNDYSLAVLARHGEVKLFFAGDAQKKRMKELQTYRLPEVDLYKVSYHGRDLTTGAKLIGSIRPQYAVVTAAAPGPEIERALTAAGARIFCTRGEDVEFVSDGERLQTGLSSENVSGTVAGDV